MANLDHRYRSCFYFPKLLQRDIGTNGVDEIGFFIDANWVLLVKKQAIIHEILRGLDVLKEGLNSRKYKAVNQLDDPVSVLRKGKVAKSKAKAESQSEAGKGS